MSEDVKINVSAPGAKQAAGDLKGVAQAEGQVGRSGRKAGKDVKQGAGEGRAALDQLGGAVGVNTSMFRSWQMAAAAAGAAMIAVFVKAAQAARELRREWRQTYREFAKQAAEPSTRQLAGIRGADEAATAKWKWQQARAYGLRPEDIGGAAFELESGISSKEELAAIGGRAGLDQLEQDAFRLMRVSSASGSTVSGLALSAFGARYADETRVAGTPAEIRKFLAQAHAVAKGSKTTLQDIGDVVGQELAGAIAAGMTVEEFLSLAAALSFRIKEPGAIRTAIRQMVAAASRGSARLNAEAAAIGRRAGDMSVIERMALQSSVIAGAKAEGGIEAGAATAAALSVSPEQAAVYASAFDASIREKMQALAGVSRAATFQRDVMGRYTTVMGTPLAAAQKTAMDVTVAKQEAAETVRLHTIFENEAKARRHRMMAAGEDIPGVLESVLPEDAAVRRMVGIRVADILEGMAADEDLPEEARAAVRSHLARGGAFGRGAGLRTGISVSESAGFLQLIVNNHGVQYQNYDKRDPAGRPRKTGME